MHVGSSLSIQLNFKTQNERPLLPACTDMQGARATISAARPVRNKHEISQFPLAISLLPKKIYRPYFNSNFQLSHNSFVENKGLVRPTMKEKKTIFLIKVIGLSTSAFNITIDKYTSIRLESIVQTNTHFFNPTYDRLLEHTHNCTFKTNYSSRRQYDDIHQKIG
jgi:hypothetical protein